MKTTDRINRANARSRRVSPVIFKILMAWLLSAIVMAIMVPSLHARGVTLQQWMVWTVILAALGLCVGPDLVRRFTKRD
ncbi:MAG TPA: hypothetical protein VJ813_01660 [Vicinamibacterales bacterium]|nr:hypothetical protein [Vicinamibacterales bacterium]